MLNKNPETRLYVIIINVWDFVSAFIRHPSMFQSTDFLFEQKRIGLVTMDLLYTRFTNLTR